MSIQKLMLKNGTVVTIRPAHPDDVDRINEMYGRISPTSLYYRYLSYTVPEDFQRICRMESSFVVTLEDETVIALAYYIRSRNSVEPAMMIEDCFQNMGLGTVLFQHLCRDARHQEVDQFNAIIYGTNSAMMRVIIKSRLPFQTKISYGVYEIAIALT